jgi:hypothetical protein
VSATATASRLQLARAMSERELQDSIRRLCDDLGLAVQHIHDPRRSWLVGWPDLVIVGNGIIYRELKSERGTLSPEQRAVGDRLELAGADFAVWRPRHLLDGSIAQRLAELASRQARLW